MTYLCKRPLELCFVQATGAQWACASRRASCCGFVHAKRCPSAQLSHLWTELCLLCIIYNTHQIHFIFICLSLDGTYYGMALWYGALFPSVRPFVPSVRPVRPSVRPSVRRTSQKNNRTSQKNYYQHSRNFWNFLFLLIIPITQASRCTTGWSDSGCWGADTS